MIYECYLKVVYYLVLLYIVSGEEDTIITYQRRGITAKKSITVMAAEANSSSKTLLGYSNTCQDAGNAVGISYILAVHLAGNTIDGRWICTQHELEVYLTHYGQQDIYLLSWLTGTITGTFAGGFSANTGFVYKDVSPLLTGGAQINQPYGNHLFKDLLENAFVITRLWKCIGYKPENIQ